VALTPGVARLLAVVVDPYRMPAPKKASEPFPFPWVALVFVLALLVVLGAVFASVAGWPKGLAIGLVPLMLLVGRIVVWRLRLWYLRRQ
jgi:hypothetical protein